MRLQGLNSPMTHLRGPLIALASDNSENVVDNTLEIIDIIAKIGTAIYTILVMIQVFVGVLFLKRARKVKEVRCLVKFLVIIGIIDDLDWMLIFILTIYFEVEIPYGVFLALVTVGCLSFGIFFSLMIRMLRV